MREDERVWAVKELLFDYVKSPSVRHIRDPHSVTHLAQEIVKRIDCGNSIWRKWDGQREHLLKSALCCWIPADDMRDFLNQMPGPRLTTTDVAQRLRAFEEEVYYDYPKEELRPCCLTIYENEKAEGTELPAIVGLLRDYVEREEERLRLEQEKRYRQRREQDRIAKKQHLLSGADCKWTQLQKSKCWYCRSNGRTYRLSPTENKRWDLHRINSVSDEQEGTLIGTYRGRREATKAISEIAYQPEPRR